MSRGAAAREPQAHEAGRLLTAPEAPLRLTGSQPAFSGFPAGNPRRLVAACRSTNGLCISATPPLNAPSLIQNTQQSPVLHTEHRAFLVSPRFSVPLTEIQHAALTFFLDVDMLLQKGGAYDYHEQSRF